MSKNFREAFKHIFIRICTVKDNEKINNNNFNNKNSRDKNNNNYLANNQNEMKVFLNGVNKIDNIKNDYEGDERNLTNSNNVNQV
jgi:hypothetical protein